MGRHYQYYPNITLLASLYPAVQRAMTYLKGRDWADVGVPSALNTSFWADWLDVDYTQGGHIYLATILCSASKSRYYCS